MVLLVRRCTPELFSSRFRNVNLSLSAVEKVPEECATMARRGHVKPLCCSAVKTMEQQGISARSVETQPICLHHSEFKWCGLCGSGNGLMMCGSCMGEGGYATKAGLAGVKGRVGWSRCKICFAKKTVPCLVCGRRGEADWKNSDRAQQQNRAPH